MKPPVGERISSVICTLAASRKTGGMSLPVISIRAATLAKMAVGQTIPRCLLMGRMSEPIVSYGFASRGSCIQRGRWIICATSACAYGLSIFERPHRNRTAYSETRRMGWFDAREGESVSREFNEITSFRTRQFSIDFIHVEFVQYLTSDGKISRWEAMGSYHTNPLQHDERLMVFEPANSLCEIKRIASRLHAMAMKDMMEC